MTPDAVQEPDDMLDIIVRPVPPAAIPAAPLVPAPPSQPAVPASPDAVSAQTGQEGWLGTTKRSVQGRYDSGRQIASTAISNIRNRVGWGKKDQVTTEPIDNQPWDWSKPPDKSNASSVPAPMPTQPPPLAPPPTITPLTPDAQPTDPIEIHRGILDQARKDYYEAIETEASDIEDKRKAYQKEQRVELKMLLQSTYHAALERILDDTYFNGKNEDLEEKYGLTKDGLQQKILALGEESDEDAIDQWVDVYDFFDRLSISPSQLPQTQIVAGRRGKNLISELVHDVSGGFLFGRDLVNNDYKSLKNSYAPLFEYSGDIPSDDDVLIEVERAGYMGRKYYDSEKVMAAKLRKAKVRFEKAQSQPLPPKTTPNPEPTPVPDTKAALLQKELQRYEDARVNTQQWIEEQFQPDGELSPLFDSLAQYVDQNGERIFDQKKLREIAQTSGEHASMDFIRNGLDYIQYLHNQQDSLGLTGNESKAVTGIRRLLSEQISNNTQATLLFEQEGKLKNSNIYYVTSKSLIALESNGYTLDITGKRGKTRNILRVKNYGFYPEKKEVWGELSIPYAAEYIRDSEISPEMFAPEPVDITGVSPEVFTQQETDELRNHTYNISLSGKLGAGDYLSDKNNTNQTGAFTDISDVLQGEKKRLTIASSNRESYFINQFGNPTHENEDLYRHNYCIFEPLVIGYDQQLRQPITDPNFTVFRYYLYRDGKRLVDAPRLNSGPGDKSYESNVLSVQMDTQSARVLEKRIQANPNNALTFLHAVAPGTTNMNIRPADGLVHLPTDLTEEFIRSLKPDTIGNYLHPFSSGA
ncbi:MAG: hypothetical protein Q8P72_01180 [Candidatus Roizmanbacteria bacterium]|nr:hypothetical protein [Candidatus Roizmanbacteria bacterium]